MDETTAQILKLPGVKRVLELVGLTATLWNNVESHWDLIFTCLLHEAPRKKVDQLLKHFPTGAAKREFIVNLAVVAFAENPDLKAAIDWLRTRTNEIAARRNDIVHGHYRFDILNGPPGLRVSPMGSTTKRGANPLAKVGHKLEKEIEATTEEIATLIDQLDEFGDYLVQNYLPPDKRITPTDPKVLASQPASVRAAMPRALREKVELRIPPTKQPKPRPKNR